MKRVDLQFSLKSVSKGTYIIIVGIIYILMSCTCSLAADKEDSRLGSIHELGEIVVTDSSQEGAKGISIDPTATIIKVDSYTSPESPQTVADILQRLPGIDIQRDDPSMSSDKEVVKIRGMNGRRIMVRMDGRPVKNVGGFSDKLIDWPSLTLESVEKVEVVRGAHSAVYGDNIGGTINIVTKKGSHRKDNIPEGEVMVDYTKWNTQYYRMGLAGNLDNFGYSLGAGYRSSDGYLRNSEYNIKDLTARVSYNLPFNGRLSFGYKGSIQDKNPFVVNDPNDSVVGNLYDSSYPIVQSDVEGWSPNYPGSDSYDDKTINNLDLIYEQNTPIGEWMIHLYDTIENRDCNFNYYSSAIGFYDYWWDVTFEEIGWIIQNQITNFKNHKITVGFDGRLQYMRYDCENIMQEWHVDRHKAAELYAGYIEDDWQITDKLRVVVGLRYDSADLSVNMDYPGFPEHMDRNWSAWSPKSRISYKIFPETTAFVNISKAFRMLTAMEYSYCSVPTGMFLEPETAMEYEGGIIQKIGKDNSLRLTYYYYDIDNYIMFHRNTMTLLAAGDIEHLIINAEYLQLQGVEAELNFKLCDQLSGYVNYTFQEPNLGPTSIPESELVDDQYQLSRHKVNLGLDWKPFENTMVMATARYVGERNDSLGHEIDGFITLDLGVSQMFLDKTLQVKGYVMNVFDEEYEERYHVPATERFFGINISYLF